MMSMPHQRPAPQVPRVPRPRSERRTMRIGSYVSGTAALCLLFVGAMKLVLQHDAVLALAWTATGIGLMNTALLLRVVRWEVPE